MRYGVIDLGSNTIRLCIYDIVGSVPKFKTLVNRKAVVGLAAYVEQGKLTEAGLKAAETALVKQLKRARLFEPERLDVFATAVLRNISNSHEVVSYLEEQTKCTINLLSDYDEAHLGFVGASFGDALNDGLLVDIGGGSTEITRVSHAQDDWNVSIGQGCLSMYERCVADVLPNVEEQKHIEAYFAGAFNECVKNTPISAHILYGVGGSIRSLAKVNATLRPECSDKIITLQDIAYVQSCLLDDRKHFINAVIRVCPERLHTLVCGLCILEEVFKQSGAEHMVVCKYGVREGYVLENMLMYE